MQNVEKQSQVKAGIVRVATIIWQGLNFVQNVEEQTNQYRSQRNGIVHADIIIYQALNFVQNVVRKEIKK